MDHEPPATPAVEPPAGGPAPPEPVPAEPGALDGVIRAAAVTGLLMLAAVVATGLMLRRPGDMGTWRTGHGVAAAFLVAACIGGALAALWRAAAAAGSEAATGAGSPVRRGVVALALILASVGAIDGLFPGERRPAPLTGDGFGANMPRRPPRDRRFLPEPWSDRPLDPGRRHMIVAPALAGVGLAAALVAQGRARRRTLV